ncbi:hypothetical protein D3C71_21470 [compost metagenome]
MEHKEMNMNNAQAELKAVAKAAGAALKRSGYTVPHSVVLHALAAAAGKRDWHVLKASIAQAEPQPDVPAPTPAQSLPAVDAKFWTDDRRWEADFDAAPYLAGFAEKELLAIIEVGFGGDYCTDAIAQEAAVHVPEISKAMEYLGIINQAPSRDSVGFECRVNEEQFLRWMDANRRPVLASFLCKRMDIRLEQAQEEEIRGMWDWIGSEQAGYGQACDQSFLTREEACLDAYSKLDLLTVALTLGY